MQSNSSLLFGPSTDDQSPGHLITPYLSFDEMELSEPVLRGLYEYGFEKPSKSNKRELFPLCVGMIL